MRDRGSRMKSSFFGRFQDWLSEWDDDKTRQVLIVLLAVLIGLLIGLLFDTIAHAIGDYMFPPPPTLNMADKEELRQLYKANPEDAFGIKTLAWAFGTLAGSYTAVRIAKLGQFPAWIVGILLFASYLIGLVSLPTPTWVLIMCPILVAVCAYGAGWLGMYVVMQKGMKAQAQA